LSLLPRLLRTIFVLLYLPNTSRAGAATLAKAAEFVLNLWC
jgi:hypothetical protein